MITKLFRKKTFLVIFILGTTLIWGAIKHSDLPSSYRTVHHVLYDYYFPANEELTYIQKAKRILFREVQWYKLSGNQDIKQLLNPLRRLKDHVPDRIKEEFPDIFKQGFYGVSSDRQEQFVNAIFADSSPEFRRQIFKLRQIWLYILYSSPLVEELSEVPSKPEEPPVFDVNLDLPPSRLLIHKDEIIHQDGEIDYLVIGSGPAGSVITHELARNKPNCNVVLVESGSFVVPQSTITEFNSNLMESLNLRQSISGGLVIRNGATVGGGTTVNIDLAFSPELPQIQNKLSSWVNSGALDKTFFHKNHNDWKKLKEAYQWVQQTVHTRHVDSDEINRNNRILFDGDPLAKTYDLNSRKLSDGVNVPKVSAVEALIVPALKGGDSYKGRLSLISDAKVDQLIFDQNNPKLVTGVRLQFMTPLNKPYVRKDLNDFRQSAGYHAIIKAKNVILSAGTLGSCEILLRSSVKNNQIGRGIIAHPSMGIIGMFNHEINVLDGLSASVYAPSSNGEYFFEAMSADPRFIAIVHPGNGHDILKTIRRFKKLGGFGIMLIDESSPQNRIYIDQKTNKVEIDYKLTESDKNRLRQGLIDAVRILISQGASYTFVPTAEKLNTTGTFSPFKSVGEATIAINQMKFIDGLNYLSSAHLQGSNKLGSLPNSSVVSPKFKVWDQSTGHEIDNLYVCDSSVFPTSVGANPMQSIYTIAKLFVDRLIFKA
ncbi:MAG: GMC family oxidoreductase [Candidatus Paracaedibacteraceae bacterium]|nr:GMC family oxidoreductase [Candidatus Paracaedibacteraceae bacterium]